MRVISLLANEVEKTIQRWMTTLKDAGYIETKNTGRCLEIGIKLWKSIDKNSGLSVQVGQRWDTRSDKSEESTGYRKWQKLVISQ